MSIYKVVRFLGGQAAGDTVGGRSIRPDAQVADLAARWASALTAVAGVPGHDPAAGLAWPGRPDRVVLGVPVAEPDFPPPPYAAVDIQWFATAADALANEEWLVSVDPSLALGWPPVGGGPSCRVVATELPLRGPEDPAALWATGGERFVMMSFGRRDPRLTLPEFLERWRHEAGSLGGQAIPDEVRGHAYVQDHPLVLPGHEWSYDAVNEVHLAQLDHLRIRRDWFAARQDAALRAGADGFMDPGSTGSLFLRAAPVSLLPPP
jgi:hypothetical protein